MTITRERIQYCLADRTQINADARGIRRFITAAVVAAYRTRRTAPTAPCSVLSPTRRSDPHLNSTRRPPG